MLRIFLVSEQLREWWFSVRLNVLVVVGKNCGGIECIFMVPCHACVKQEEARVRLQIVCVSRVSILVGEPGVVLPLLTLPVFHVSVDAVEFKPSGNTEVTN